MIVRAASQTGRATAMAYNMAAKLVRDIRGWMKLSDYEDAKKKATMDVVRRYARRNVLFQNGYVLDEEALRKLSAAGDRATARLERSLHTS